MIFAFVHHEVPLRKPSLCFHYIQIKFTDGHDDEDDGEWLSNEIKSWDGWRAQREEN